MKIKGQVTIFIIVAILIVAGVALFFVFKDSLGIGKSSSEIESINNLILSCLETVSNEGINYVALRGGYYKIPEELYYFYLSDEFSYYYLDSRKNMPSIERVNEELGNYISDNIEDCLNFSLFEKQGFKINRGKLLISSDIQEEKVVIKLSYPIVINKEEDSFRLNDFDIKISSSLFKLYSAAEEITILYSLESGLVCLTCLDEISNRYNLNVRSVALTSELFPEKDVFFFSVLDEEDELNLKFVVER